MNTPRWEKVLGNPLVLGLGSTLVALVVQTLLDRN